MKSSCYPKILRRYLISGSPDPIACFYGFWTRKEALMKAEAEDFT
jgi:phosphopantetheinyl transferase